MAKFFCVFLITIIFFLPAGCARTNTDMEKYVVKITVYHDDVCAQGTGFLCEGYTITSAHIFKGNDEAPSICSADNMIVGKYEPELLFIDEDNDVAILTSPTCDGAKVSDDFACGRCVVFTCEDMIECRKINIVDIDVSGKPDTLITLDAYLPKGSSGAPIVNCKGNVIGIIVARDMDGRYSYAVPSKYIKRSLSQANRLYPD